MSRGRGEGKIETRIEGATVPIRDEPAWTVMVTGNNRRSDARDPRSP
jgi:hypothetical protein